MKANTRAEMAPIMASRRGPKLARLARMVWICSGTGMQLPANAFVRLGVQPCAKMKSGRAQGERGPVAGKTVKAASALEELQDALGVRIGDRQRLDAELLLHLQCLQPGRFLVHVGVD